MREVGLFVKAIWKHWFSLMCGIFSLVLTVISFGLDQNKLAVAFGVLCVAAILIACFLAWRDAHREARPYEQETFGHAKAVFESLPHGIKVVLEQLAIEKVAFYDSIRDEMVDLERTGFVIRDPTLGSYRLDPEYSSIVQRLVKEWRATATPMGA